MTCLTFYSFHGFLEYISQLSITDMEICGVCAVGLTGEQIFVDPQALEGLKEESQNARPHKEWAHLQLKGHNDRLTLSISYLSIYSFKIWFHSVAQAGPKLLPRYPKSWDYRYVPPCPDFIYLLTLKKYDPGGKLSLIFTVTTANMSLLNKARNLPARCCLQVWASPFLMHQKNLLLSGAFFTHAIATGLAVGHRKSNKPPLRMRYKKSWLCVCQNHHEG